jgi:endonuclease-3
MGKEQERKIRALEIDQRLKKIYPDARTALHYTTPLELLVATILSAQCTDEKVNEVTKVLFKKYKTAGDYAKAPLSELENLIRPTGFFRNKAKSIQKCCHALVEKFSGGIPRTMEEMVDLPGVGRKTANLVLGAVYGIPGIVVDTHVRRLAGRLGLTDNTDPDKIEFDLMPLLPQQRWTSFSHQMVYHGRNTCTARNPGCPHCLLLDICPWPNHTKPHEF